MKDLKINLYSELDTCPMCGVYTPDGEVCPSCIEKSSLCVAEAAASVYGKIEVEPEPYTLTIDTKLIKLIHSEMDIEFNLEPDKLKNIDTLVINGYKYVKETT